MGDDQNEIECEFFDYIIASELPCFERQIQDKCDLNIQQYLGMYSLL